MCVSERFRKQFRHVWIGNCQNGRRRTMSNQVRPQVQLEQMNQTPKIVLETIEIS